MKSFSSFFTEKTVFPKGDSYYADAINFFVGKYGINPNSLNIVIQYKDHFDGQDGLTIQSPKDKKSFLVYIGKNTPQADLLRVLAHEARHIVQLVNGDLEMDYRTGKISWKGKEVDLEKIPYRRRPFEIEAYEYEKKYIIDFIKEYGNLLTKEGFEDKRFSIVEIQNRNRPWEKDEDYKKFLKGQLEDNDDQTTIRIADRILRKLGVTVREIGVGKNGEIFAKGSDKKNYVISSGGKLLDIIEELLYDDRRYSHLVKEL